MARGGESGLIRPARITTRKSGKRADASPRFSKRLSLTVTR